MSDKPSNDVLRRYKYYLDSIFHPSCDVVRHCSHSLDISLITLLLAHRSYHIDQMRNIFAPRSKEQSYRIHLLLPMSRTPPMLVGSSVVYNDNILCSRWLARSMGFVYL